MTDPDAALRDALTTEHGVIYGYGLVSAHSLLEANDLVAAALRAHRDRRDQLITLLTGRGVDAPVAAAGYQLPMPVTNPTEASQLAVRMERDAAVAWRAVVEQAQTDQDRAFGVAALTDCAATEARWNIRLGVTPVIGAFPGGTE